MQYTMLNYGIVLNNAYTGKKQHIQNFLMWRSAVGIDNYHFEAFIII